MESLVSARGFDLLLALAGATAFVFVARYLDQGWVPHDDGAFAQSAQRVLAGELPHRDFTELYTGGLTFLNAAVFAVLGENLIWLRLPLFALFVVFVPCVYLIARRFVGPTAAALTALLAVTWGLPLYPAPVPSWYLLFFATFGAAALLRYLDTRHTRWLFVAGVFGGVSISFKIVGVWYVLAALLFLVFVEQESQPRSERRRLLPGAHLLLVVAAAFTCAALVASVLRDRLGPAELVNLLLPVMAICAVVVINEQRVSPSVPVRRRLAATARHAVPFLAGVALPVLVVVAPFAVTGSLDDLLRGVFVSPQTRLDFAYQSTPRPVYLLFGIPLLLLFAARRVVRPRVRWVLDAAFAVGAALLVATASGSLSYNLLWGSARTGAPLIPLLGALALLVSSLRGAGGRDRRPVFLLIALPAFVSLLQFPHGGAIYFVYSVPLFALGALAVVRHTGVHGGVFPIALLAAYVAFGFFWLDRAPPIYALGSGFVPREATVILDPSRASIRVAPREQGEYRRTVELLRQHSSGRYTYAGPDAPEVYFLAGLENPTRSLFDFLDRSGSARGERLLGTLRASRVSAIAIHLDPPFSRPLDETTLRALRARYRQSARVGRFEVRWG